MLLDFCPKHCRYLRFYIVKKEFLTNEYLSECKETVFYNARRLKLTKPKILPK